MTTPETPTRRSRRLPTPPADTALRAASTPYLASPRLRMASASSNTVNA
jgi:hypothetical protein